MQQFWVRKALRPEGCDRLIDCHCACWWQGSCQHYSDTLLTLSSSFRNPLACLRIGILIGSSLSSVWLFFFKFWHTSESIFEGDTDRDCIMPLRNCIWSCPSIVWSQLVREGLSIIQQQITMSVSDSDCYYRTLTLKLYKLVRTKESGLRKNIQPLLQFELWEKEFFSTCRLVSQKNSFSSSDSSAVACTWSSCPETSSRIYANGCSSR